MITSEDYEVLESAETDDAKVEILQFGQLAGSADVRAGTQLATIKRCDMKLKMIRVTLKKESHVRVEPGGLYYMKGNLEIKASTGGGIVKGLFRKMTSGETFFVSQIHGVGEIYLEPTFGHFFLHRIDGSEGGVICDKGMFYAGTSGLDISATSQKSLSAGMFGGEGWFQTKITGTGIAVMFSPVPTTEIQKFTLTGDKLQVDGNFALMRSEAISFTAEKSIVNTAIAGEGILQTFSGTGNVWVAPTQGVYERLATPGGLASLAAPPGSMGTITESSV